MANDPTASVIRALDAMQTALDMLRSSLTDDASARGARLVCIKEAARTLALSERSIRRLAQSGAGVKVGGVWRIDLDRIIDRHSRRL